MKSFFYCSILMLFYLAFSSFITSDHKWLLFAMQIVTIYASIWIWLRENKKNRVFILLIVPFSILIGFGIFVERPTGYIRGLPYILLLPFLGYLCFIALKRKSFLLGVLILLLIPINSFVVFPNWFIYSIERDYMEGKAFPMINVVNEYRKKVSLPNDKILVLDFWTTNCGVCFKKFPDFEKLKVKYKDNPNIIFYSVNVPIRKDTFNNTLKIVKDLNYRYETIYAVNQKETQESLNFNAYPKLFLVQDNKIIYSGGLHIKKHIIFNNIINKIERLL